MFLSSHMLEVLPLWALVLSVIVPMCWKQAQREKEMDRAKSE